MSTKKMISAQELSSILGLSVDTVWRYTRENRIPYVEVGPRQYRYIEDEVLRVLSQNTGSTIHEESADYGYRSKLTYEDYAKIPSETGITLQLIDGLLIREPTPTYQHQRISRRLQQILLAYFTEIDPEGEVFNAPLDIHLDKHTIVQPDLLYLPSARPARNNPVDSLPELVVEILSPSTARNDRIKKLNSYQKAGVKHYWIVDPHDRLIEAYELKDSHYVSIARFADEIFDHPSFPGLSFDVATLFA